MHATHDDVLSALGARRPGHSLARLLYTHDAAHELDLQRVFYRQWLFALAACELPRAGDRATLQVGDYPVLVVRGEDARVRAFHNSCRHRGSRVCTEARGSGTRLVCPYHQWTYGLDGALEFARDPGDDFDASEHALAPVHCEEIAGTVWICLAAEAPPLDAFAREARRYLAPHGLDHARVAHTSTLVENGNWKLVLENNRECYHCAGSHPSLCRTYSDRPVMAGSRGEADPEVLGHWGRCEADGLPSRFVLAPDEQWRLTRMPLLGDACSFTLDGRPATTRRMGDMPFDDAGSLMLFHFPNTWNHFLADHAVLFRVLPLGPDRTEVTTTWLVRADAVEGVDYDVERLIAVWETTNDEDRRVVEENQRGIASPAYRPGPYSPIQEAGVVQFVDWYARAIEAAGAEADDPAAAPTGDAPSGDRRADVRPIVPMPDALRAARTPPTVVDAPPATPVRSAGPAAPAPSVVPDAPASRLPYVAPLGPESPGSPDHAVALPEGRDAGGGAWSDDEPLECVSRVPEATDVVTFGFKSPSDAWFDYRAGQFVTLELPLPGGVEHRTYTLSSSPSRPLSIGITVKAQPGSVGSRWMLDHLYPGMRLRARGPAGLFSYRHHRADKYLMIAAGSGITPMMSMIGCLFDRGDAADVGLIMCARTPAELVFRRQLELMASRQPSLTLNFVVARDDPHDAWTGYRGRFNRLMLGLMAPDYLEREIFCCGPEGFMQSVRDMLDALGHDMRHYHQESFGAPVEHRGDLPALDDVVPDEAIDAEIVFRDTATGVARTVHRPQTETLLAAARSAGLSIASGCTFGVCGTCRVRKTAGEVHMVHSGGISEADIEAGYVLACCSRPTGHVEIELA